MNHLTRHLLLLVALFATSALVLGCPEENGVGDDDDTYGEGDDDDVTDDDDTVDDDDTAGDDDTSEAQAWIPPERGWRIHVQRSEPGDGEQPRVRGWRLRRHHKPAR